MRPRRSRRSRTGIAPVDEEAIAAAAEKLTDLQLAGPVAQYGRGLVQDVSSQLVGQFADRLKKQLAASTPEEAKAAAAEQSRPVGGLRLGLGAPCRSVVRFFRHHRG